MIPRKSILNSIPTEILREIAATLCTPHDQVAFCGVSRLFNAITVPVLYRHIHLDNVVQTLACFRALEMNPKRYEYVRSLHIDIVHSDRDYVPTDIIWPLESGLHRLDHLEDLYLRIPEFNDAYLIIFATLFLPALRKFSTYHTGTYSPILSSFVNRHTDLTHLDLIRPWTAISPPLYMLHTLRLQVQRLKPDAPPPLPPLQLPRLCFYGGCSAYARRVVVSARGLLCAHIWDVPPLSAEDLEALIAALAAATSPTTPFELMFLWDGPQTALFAPLAKHIPQTRVLRTGPFMDPQRALSAVCIILLASTHSNTNSQQEAVQEIAGSLDYFVSLAHFEFDNVEGGTHSYSKAADLAVLTTWSTHCPTLMTSRLHCRNWTRETGNGEWICLD
ncbi:hypothetical protein B0H12DRAFT_1327688 [Mycena haematopus]|nr:hypothetical protein B0H12DRAFT_1327688 [Mycena haematopus]